MSLSSRSNCLQVIAVGVVAGWASCASIVWASEQTPVQAPAAKLKQDVPATHPVDSGDLSHKTDTELTALTAQWAKLSPSQRRQLLAEVRGRMAASRQVRGPQARGRVGVQVQRRYGRVVRKSDGSVVVQTRVVRVRPRVEGTTAGRVTFGIGFEQRSKSRQDNAGHTRDAGNPAPAVTVSQQPDANQVE